jgi:hypothetical protein
MRKHYPGARLGVIACLLLGLLAAALAADPASSSGGEQYLLRGYRDVRHTVEQRGVLPRQVVLHRFSFDDPEHAGWFASKIYSDLELTQGNTVKPLATPAGPVDAIDLAGQGLIVPLLASGSRDLVVLVGSDAETVAAQVPALVRASPLRRAQLTHPLYLDKWDRYCLGVWQAVGDFAYDSERKDLDSFYQWLGEIGLNPQMNMGTETYDLVSNDNVFTWLRAYFAKYHVKYQRVEWLLNQPDLYNRNPFLAKTINPHVASRWNYYGEVREGVNPLRDAQNASFLTALRRLADDPNQMAILDPDGEIGPFDVSYWGVSGPVAQREFVRFLREVRKLSLDDVSRRYYGKPGALKSWEEVTLADWRTFYGWTDGAVDLAGEWRFLRDDQLQGYAQGWSLPGFNDSDWIRLYYPGDALVYSLTTPDRPLWMRKTVTVDPGAWQGRVYLSLAPLSNASVQVFLNGRPLGSLDPRFHTALTWGQFDITDELAKSHTLTVVLRFASGDAPNGPIFLTPKKLEEFPTSDPLLNARRWDQMEFVDWDTAQGVASSLRAVRSVDPDRPIKVHAYGGSPWGWQTVAAYGGYSHHTGSGSGWTYTEPKQLGASRNLQDSSEPGGPMPTLRDLKGLFGNLIFMGKNAHDYFISLQSITRDPQMRAYFLSKLPAIKVMGRAHVVVSPIAVVNAYLNARYFGEFSRWEIWRYGLNPVRGGELIPYLDEVRIREGNLGRFRVIIDPGSAECWDEQMTAAFRAYVENGGVLLLNNLSGANTFLARGEGAGPGPTLAGVRLAGVPPTSNTLTFTQADPSFGGITGEVKIEGRYGVPSRTLAPQPGTEVLATWPDGSPAFTRRALGKGVVYYCGGSQYPGDLFKGLAAAYGPAVYAHVEGGADLLRTLQSNNGCEDLLMVRGLGDKPATVQWTFDYPPPGLYDPVTGQAVDAKIEGNVATFTVTIPDWDFAWFAARRPRAADDFSHWFIRQTEIWSGFTANAKAPEVPLFRHLDLNHDWKLAQTDSWESAQALLALDDTAAKLVPTELVLWNTPGMNFKTGPNVAGLYRRDFTLPAFWERDSLFTLAVRGQIHDCPIHGFLGKSALYLNGKVIWEGDRLDSARIDVTALVTPGRNRLEIVHQGNGIMPSIMLERSPKPDNVIDLAGPWRAVTGPHQEAEVTLPATIQAAFVYRDVTVPAAAGSQEVWLRVDGPCPFVIINGHLRYWDMWGVTYYAAPTVYEVDITPDVRFGRPNRIVLGTGGMFHGWAVAELAYKRVELACYRPGRWSADGQGTRQALTAKELASVARDLSVIQSYPLIHPAVEKPVPALVPAGTEGTPPTLPPVLVDFDLHPAEGIVADRGPNHVPVTIKGNVEPISEAGGRITGVYLHGESATPGTILLPPAGLRRRMEGKSVTFRVWLKPMAINRSGGVLADWVDYNLNWRVDDTRTVFSLSDPPSRRLIAESVIRQRTWQCLTLVLDGVSVTLYADGLPVGMQSWNKPLAGIEAPFCIGSTQGVRDFLNAKLGAFTIYEGALSGEEVARLYLQERARYARDLTSAWPEDDLFRLAAGDQGPYDAAEIPAQIQAGPGVQVKRDDGAPYLSFSGEKSYLLVRDHPRARDFADPFSLIWDLRRAEGSSGMIFRRHHILCLSLEKDGTLVFDANIGRNNRVSFPAAVPAGHWVRLMLTYDRQTVRLFRDGQLLAERPYPGSIVASDYPIVIFSDNTHPRFPDWGNVQADLREFRVIPWVLPAMPAPAAGAP